MLRVPRRSFLPPERQKKTFPDIITRGKAISTVGMPADGIAYNHYGIKYVLKRLEDQRGSKGNAHMKGEREQGGIERQKERVYGRVRSTYMARHIKRVNVRRMTSRHSE